MVSSQSTKGMTLYANIKLQHTVGHTPKPSLINCFAYSYLYIKGEMAGHTQVAAKSLEPNSLKRGENNQIDQTKFKCFKQLYFHIFITAFIQVHIPPLFYVPYFLALSFQMHLFYLLMSLND